MEWGLKTKAERGQKYKPTACGTRNTKAGRGTEWGETEGKETSQDESVPMAIHTFTLKGGLYLYWVIRSKTTTVLNRTGQS